MPDFTVIEGDGSRDDFEKARAKQIVKTLIVEALRAVARGDDSQRRVAQAIIDFYEHAAHLPVSPIVDSAMAELHESAIARDPFDDGMDAQQRRILQAALRVAAESMSLDSAAGGRKSKRESELERAIERRLISSEERSRKNGWSFTQSLMSRHLGEWSPKPVQPQPARKATKALIEKRLKKP